MGSAPSSTGVTSLGGWKKSDWKWWITWVLGAVRVRALICGELGQHVAHMRLPGALRDGCRRDGIQTGSSHCTKSLDNAEMFCLSSRASRLRAHLEGTVVPARIAHSLMSDLLRLHMLSGNT